jgi:hypothetical protein
MATSKKTTVKATAVKPEPIAAKPEAKTAAKPAAATAAKASKPVAPKAAAVAKTPEAPKAAAKVAAKPKAPAKKAAKAATGNTVPAEQRAHYIEIAAFYIAERRNFAPGNPLEDWVAAEAEIDRLLAEGRLG